MLLDTPVTLTVAATSLLTHSDITYACAYDSKTAVATYTAPSTFTCILQAAASQRSITVSLRLVTVSTATSVILTTNNVNFDFWQTKQLLSFNTLPFVASYASPSSTVNSSVAILANNAFLTDRKSVV